MNITNYDWQAFGSGFLMQFGLVMSIGLQNLYIIQKGIKREFPFWVALTCCVCEFILLAASVFGAGAIMTIWPEFQSTLTTVAIGFLICYGSVSLFRAFFGKNLVNKLHQESAVGFWGSIMAAMGFSLLNPQAIVEGFVFYGGVAQSYGDSTLMFLAGAVAGGCAWILSLATVVTFTFPRNPSVRFMRVLSGVSGVIMMAIAVKIAF